MILTSEQFFKLVNAPEPFRHFNIEITTCAFGDRAEIIYIGKKAKDITRRTLYWSPKRAEWVEELEKKK